MINIMIIALPFFITGLILQVPGHILTSLGYVAWGDFWSAKQTWLDLFNDIYELWFER